MAKFEVCKHLGDSWHDLADVLKIPPHEQRRFTLGREPQGVWEWLELRGRLSLLPEILDEIDRPDLALRLRAERAMPAGRDPLSAKLADTPTIRGDLSAELTALDLKPTDWCLVASRVATVRGHLTAYAEESADDPRSAALAAELEQALELLATHSAGLDDWRVARELRDALIARLGMLCRPD